MVVARQEDLIGSKQGGGSAFHEKFRVIEVATSSNLSTRLARDPA
jgi:hypothetical protein